MVTSTRTRATPATSILARRWFAVLTVVATVFVFVQFFTSSEFVRSQEPITRVWIAVHGFTAYGVLAPALAAALIAVIALRRSMPMLSIIAVAFFLASVGQWGTGHLINTLHLNGWTPFHIFFSSVVLALAVWASIRSVMLVRTGALVQRVPLA